MKKLVMLVLLLVLVSCESGKFTPKRHQLYDLGHPDCEENPERCVNGYPW